MTLLANLRKAHSRRKAARQLRDLPPHLLRDIGVEPGQIDEAVSGMLAANGAGQGERPLPNPARRPAPDLLSFKASIFSNADWPYPRRRAA